MKKKKKPAEPELKPEQTPEAAEAERPEGQEPEAQAAEPKPKAEKPAKPPKPLWITIVKWVAVIVLVASLMLNISTYLFPVVRHYGSCMAPTLSENQLLLMLKTDSVDSGDVIAFYYNNNIMVRRVIACPGETVDIDIFGQVSVNGRPLKEEYVSTPALGQTDISFPFMVPANCYFVMGDQREISMDSRLTEIGPVPKDRIVGRLIFSLSPFGSVD